MKLRAQVGNPHTFKPRWYHLFLLLTYLPALAVLFVIGILVMVANFLLMDTHHLEFKCRPKRADTA